MKDDIREIARCLKRIAEAMEARRADIDQVKDAKLADVVEHIYTEVNEMLQCLSPEVREGL